MKNISYKRYVATFHILEKRSEEYGYQLRHLLKEANDLKSGFSILDVGAGRGLFARSFIERSKKRVGAYTAIEPSAGHIKDLKRNFVSFRGGVDIIRGKFTPKTDFKTRFDLIIMSHTVYWFVPDIKAHLKNALRLLSKNGKLVIYLQAFAAFSCILNTFLRAKDPIYPHRISSREITQILDSIRIPYSISYLPGTLRADDVLRPGNKKLLDDLISFCLFSEAGNLSTGDLKFAEDLVRLLSYKTDKGTKLNLSVAAITVRN